MSRRSKSNQQNAGGIGIPGYMPQGHNQGGGGGGSKTYSGPVNIQLGKKGVTVTGQGIQTVTVPLRAKTSQQQQGVQTPFQGWQGGGGGGSSIPAEQTLQSCILAATSLGQIAQQQFALHQQTMAANQQLLTALTQLAPVMGLTMQQQGTKKQRRQYQNPTAQVQQQRSSKKQRQNSQQQANLQYQFA